MAALLHPGVYVQEVPSGVRSIEGVPTSTAIFVGEAERGPLVPTKIRSATEYARTFGGHLRHEATGGPRRVLMRYSIDLFFQNGGTSAYVQRASFNGTSGANLAVSGRRMPGAAVGSDILKAASEGEWGNHIYAIVVGTPQRFRIVVYYQSPGATAASFVEDWDRLSPDPQDPNFVGEVLLRSTYIRWVDSNPALSSFDTVVGANILELTQGNLDTMNAASGILFNSDNATGANNDETVTDTRLSEILLGLDGIDDAAILVGASERWFPGGTLPFPDDTVGAEIKAYHDRFRAYVEARPKLDLFYISDAPRFGASTGVSDMRSYVVGSAPVSPSTFAGLYWPHLHVADPVGPTLTSTARVPPSGVVAGLFARTDARRGVWKAPAGVEVTVGGAVRMDRNVIDGEQDDLNPIGVNVIRPIPGAGTVIWGARTMVPTSEWRYIPVRRTAMFLRKSIFNGIQFAVFEPNDTNLWGTLRAAIGAFMDAQFRNGAFAGATAREAYFVKVDAETTTPSDQAAGIVNILVGFAPLRPAEFVVVRLSQKTAASA